MITPSQDAWNKIAVLAILRDGRPKSYKTIDNLRIQKLGFRSELKGQSIGQFPAFFPFFRYNLGPFSKELANQVSGLEERDFVDSESRSLTWRGKYLLEYVEPEIQRFDAAQASLEIIRETCAECSSIKESSRLVDATYNLKVPVAGLGGQIMRVRDIPMNTDILIPNTIPALPMLSPEMVVNIEAEWRIPATALDSTSQEFNDAVDAIFQRAMQA